MGLGLELFNEGRRDPERPAAQVDLDLPILFGLGRTEVTKHMVGRRGCAQRANRPYAVEAGSRRDGRRPPRLCPTNSAGMPIVLCIQCTAATMSATLDEKPPRPKSPSLSPRPVKSKRSVAMPC